MWYQDFLYNNEERIIRRWIQKVDDEFHDLYNSVDLYHNGKQYVRLLMDWHLSFKEHPSFPIIHIMCKYHAERGTPVEHILHSSHLWRESFLEIISLYHAENELSHMEIWEASRQIHKRIDEVQREISRVYWNYAQDIINQKQKKIDELHHERLTMLGKLAASMAHEIRNPLTAIGGFLQLIKKDLTCLSCNSHTKMREYIHIIEMEFEGLYRQITSFLSFSKNNGTEEPFVECSLTEIIEPVLTLAQPRIINESIELVKFIEKDSTLIVQKTAIQQVITNLINNSVDALSTIDQPKKITIRSWEDSDNYYISVYDNGPGIPKKLQKSIFDPFITSKENGTGLGLAICKQIMEKNIGDLSFTSCSCCGTVFTISLVKNCGLKAS